MIIIYFIAEKPAKVKASVVPVLQCQAKLQAKDSHCAKCTEEVKNNKQTKKFAAWGCNRRIPLAQAALPLGQSVPGRKK